MQDEPERAFAREELMHVCEDPQVPPDWVSEWKQILLNNFCNPPQVIKLKNDYHKHA